MTSNLGLFPPSIPALLEQWRKKDRTCLDDISPVDTQGRFVARMQADVFKRCADELAEAVAAVEAAQQDDPSIDCPLCGKPVRQVSSATLSLALWQHVHWACVKGEAVCLPPQDKNDLLTATTILNMLAADRPEGLNWPGVARLFRKLLPPVAASSPREGQQ